VLGLTAVTGAARVRLNREIEIGERLAQIHGLDEHTYPAGLSRLVGYTADAPYRAVIACSGEPLADRAGTFDDSARTTVARTMLHGLRPLAQARVVHRTLSPQTVLWDPAAGTTQFAGFSAAAFVGTLRSEGATGNHWSAPEVLQCTGVDEPADDLYSVALIIFWLFSGEEPEGNRAMMERRLSLQDRQVAQRLAGVFAADPRRRPDLDTLISRWAAGAGRPQAVSAPRTKYEAEAIRDFDALRARQLADHSPLVEPSWIEPSGIGPSWIGPSWIGPRGALAEVLTARGLITVLGLAALVVLLVLLVR
jgi:hypothetical protein